MKTHRSKTIGRNKHPTTRKPTASNIGRSSRQALLRQHRSSYPLHKRLVLHPLAIFVCLCTGVFMVGYTYHVVAATIISATIEAPPLTQAATVTSPQPQSHTTSVLTTVTGTCPSDSYVGLAINGAYNGAAMCETDNSYSILASLYPGTNTLKVQAYNTTDSAGPSTDPIQITYDAPTLPILNTGNQPASTDQDNAANDVAASAPVLLTSSFQFHTFKQQQTFDWALNLEGGTPPYDVVIDWGDGKTSKLHFPEDPLFHIQHNYDTPGYYAVVVKSVDSTNQLRSIQLAALITDSRGNAPFLSTGSDSGSNLAATNTAHTTIQQALSKAKWLSVAWPSYIIVVLMTISFWLGEKRELLLVYARPVRKPRH